LNYFRLFVSKHEKQHTPLQTNMQDNSSKILSSVIRETTSYNEVQKYCFVRYWPRYVSSVNFVKVFIM